VRRWHSGRPRSRRSFTPSTPCRSRPESWRRCRAWRPPPPPATLKWRSTRFTRRSSRPAPGAPSAYVVRDGATYRLRPEADIWLDAAVFEQECAAGIRLITRGTPERAIEHLLAALQLYGDNYLPDALYEDWAGGERERLLALYLRAADALAATLVERGRYDEALDVCRRILAHDPCWEQAYRLMMRAYARQGNRPQALRIY
jgi:LuxR family transcriptional regulator, maltose regulon positive regulatory protein